MILTEDQVPIAFKRGLECIKDKHQRIVDDRAYYESEHPRLDWISKIRKVFGSDVADQVHMANYCAKAIDAPLARMAVEGFDDQTATDLFQANGLDIAQEDLYRDAMIAPANYVIVQEAEEGSPLPYEIVVQQPEDVHVEMASLMRGDRAWAVKMWADYENSVYRAMLWDDVNYYKWVSSQDPNKQAILPSPDAFQPDDEDPEGAHGFDKPPVISFQRGRNPVSRLKALKPVNDRINMLEIQKVIAGIFGASRQRVYFTAQDLQDGDVEASPDFAIVLDPGGGDTGMEKASVTEFEHTPLENFDGGIDSEIDRFYELADLPKHGRMNPGADSSGVAMKVDEGPFTAMISGYLRSWGASWSDVFELIGIDTKPTWGDIETHDEGETATTVKTMTDAGMPLKTALRLYAGLTDEELREFEKDKAEADAASAQAEADLARSMMAGRDPFAKPGTPIGG